MDLYHVVALAVAQPAPHAVRCPNGSVVWILDRHPAIPGDLQLPGTAGHSGERARRQPVEDRHAVRSDDDFGHDPAVGQVHIRGGGVLVAEHLGQGAQAVAAAAQRGDSFHGTDDPQEAGDRGHRWGHQQQCPAQRGDDEDRCRRSHLRDEALGHRCGQGEIGEQAAHAEHDQPDPEATERDGASARLSNLDGYHLHGDIVGAVTPVRQPHFGVNAGYAD